MGLLKRPKRRVQRPAGSFWYDRGIPLLLATLGIATLLLIALAIAILFRLVPWR